MAVIYCSLIPRSFNEDVRNIHHLLTQYGLWEVQMSPSLITRIISSKENFQNISRMFKYDMLLVEKNSSTINCSICADGAMIQLPELEASPRHAAIVMIFVLNVHNMSLPTDIINLLKELNHFD